MYIYNICHTLLDTRVSDRECVTMLPSYILHDCYFPHERLEIKYGHREQDAVDVDTKNTTTSGYYRLCTSLRLIYNALGIDTGDTTDPHSRLTTTPKLIQLTLTLISLQHPSDTTGPHSHLTTTPK